MGSLLCTRLILTAKIAEFDSVACFKELELAQKTREAKAAEKELAHAQERLCAAQAKVRSLQDKLAGVEVNNHHREE